MFYREWIKRLMNLSWVNGKSLFVSTIYLFKDSSVPKCQGASGKLHGRYYVTSDSNWNKKMKVLFVDRLGKAVSRDNEEIPLCGYEV